MKLGVSAQFVIGSTVFSETKNFMERLGFVKVKEGTTSIDEKYAIYSDGRAQILLNESEEFDYSGIIYFTPDIVDVVEKLEAAGIHVTIQEDKRNNVSAFFITKDGIPVNIVQGNGIASSDPFGETAVPYGYFGEYSIHVGDLDDSIGYWKKLGFDVLLRDDKWEFAILSDGLLILGLHAHEMGVKTALTYFHPDMAKVIRKLKTQGFSFEEETTYELNGKKAIDAALKAPGGQVFFLFTGDVK